MTPALPAWEPGTVALLTTVDDAGAPHAIPVSTALRAGERTVVLALALTRGSLARLRERPRVALTVLTTGVAVTAHGVATVVEEPLAESPRVAAVRLDVDRVADHLTGAVALERPAVARWLDEEARARDASVHAGLRRLADAVAGSGDAADAGPGPSAAG